MKHKVKGLDTTIPVEVIRHKIFFVRGQKIMLDRDLSALYMVTTGNLNKTVRRNLERFPEDFMFQLTSKEASDLVFQIGRPKKGRGGNRYLPYAFTELGVAMLSSILNSDRAIKVNIQIMRVFTKLREIMITHKDLAVKIQKLERKFAQHDKKFVLVFDAIKHLIAYPNEAYKKTKIGFITNQ